MKKHLEYSNEEIEGLLHLAIQSATFGTLTNLHHQLREQLNPTPLENSEYAHVLSRVLSAGEALGYLLDRNKHGFLYELTALGYQKQKELNNRH